MAQNNSTGSSGLDNSLDSIFGNKQGNDSSSSQNLIQKNPATGLTDDQANALSAVIQAAHKEHAKEAVATMGVDNAAALIALHNLTSPTIQKEGNKSPSTSSDSQVSPIQQDPIQKQASNIVAPSNPMQHPIGSILNVLGNLTGITPAAEGLKNMQLGNLAQAQKIIAGQPAEIAVPLAQAAEIQQKIAGAEPLQPKDIADLNRQTYSATIQAANDAWARNTDEIKTMQEQYRALQDNKNVVQKTLGQTTPQMDALQKTIIAKMEQNQTHLQNMKTLFQNPPKAVNNKSNNNVKVGKYTLVK